MFSGNRVEFDDPGSHDRLYHCKWEIRNSSLFLIEFDAKSDGVPVNPSTVFGSKDLPLLATWYTGKVTVLEKPVEPEPLHWREPQHVNAIIYLVQEGHVIQMRRVYRLRMAIQSYQIGFALKRIDDKLVAEPRYSAHDGTIGFGHQPKHIIGGDIIHGILDPNGISMSFTNEPASLANALLSGDTGNHFTVIR